MYVENLPLEGALTRHVRPLAVRARRIAAIDASGRARRSRTCRCSPPPTSISAPFGAAAVPRHRAADGAPDRRGRRRPLRRRHRRRRRQRGPRRRARTRPSSSASTTSRCRSSSTRTTPRRRGAAVPGGRHERRPRGGSPSTDEDCSTAATSSSRARSSASDGAGPMEPRSAARRLGRGRRLTLWLSTQTPHQDRDGARRSARRSTRRRCGSSRPDVGGGFGAKMLGAEDMLVAWLARRTGRPVRWTETRSESMVALTTAARQNHGVHDRRHEGRHGPRLPAGRPPGRGRVSGIGAFLPNLTQLMASGVYAIPKIEFEGVSVVTNTLRSGPSAARAVRRRRRRSSERWTCSPPRSAMDPAEVRRKNFIPNDAFPYTTVTGAPVRHRRLRGRARPRARRGRLRRPARRAEAAARRGRPAAARHRPRRATSRSRTGSPRRSSATVEITPGRRRDRPHRLVLPRAGPRDDVRDARRRAARDPDREDHGRATATPTWSPQGHRDVRVEVAADRRRGGARAAERRWSSRRSELAAD